MSPKTQRVEQLLQNDYSDYWHVSEIDENHIDCYFQNEFRFSLECDDGDWYISGKNLPLDILYDLHIIINN